MSRLFERLAAIFEQGGTVAWLITVVVLVVLASWVFWLFGIDVSGIVANWTGGA